MYDLVIVGGGQAGLAAAYYAAQKHLRYIVLEADDSIGSSWHHRYDSLTLFTPRAYSSLPGLAMSGAPDGYPTKTEVVTYLQRYVSEFELAIALGESVRSVVTSGTGFAVTTATHTYNAASVIVATGPFQTPRTPDWSDALTMQRMHSADYRNPAQIAGNDVLVVGGGNSGAQIAEELAATHRVTMAVMGGMRFLPAKILGKSLFWWLDTTGLLNAASTSVPAKLLRRRGDPIIGTNLRQLISQGDVTIRPPATGGSGDSITFADQSHASFDAVIWCTGYRLAYPWIAIPEVIDDKGQPRHRAGQTNVPGLFFLGLGWMRSRNSALLGGVGTDASVIVDAIAQRRQLRVD